MPMKTIWLLMSASIICLPAAADDTWAGRYRANWQQGSPSTDGEVSIARASDATPNMASSKSDTNLSRWTFSSPGKNKLIELRRFLPEEYDGLQSSGPIECLSGRNIALCNVKPGTTISFDGGGAVPEKFLARTGYFGIFVRNGAAVFELTRLNSTP